MTRRTFLASPVAAAPFMANQSGSAVSASPESKRHSPECYELRVYHARRGRQHDSLSQFFQHAWLPAMNRLGVAPIGFFEVMVGPENPSIYVLIPFQSLATLATLAGRLAEDSEFQRAGTAVINAPASDPAYVRMENSLMVSFDAMPRLEQPDFGPRQAGRIFELRTYESHSQKAHRKKIAMFNTGEMAIFRGAGLRAVFFGDTLIGQKLPQLTYMLAFDSMESHDKNWTAFVRDPAWKKLSATPGYTDAEIVSNISNLFLRPTSYSQI